MLGEDHFRSRLVRLQPSEMWNHDARNEDELTFVFVKGGIGKCLSLTMSQRLLPGDILVFNGNSDCKLYADEKADCLFNSFSVFFEHLFPLFASNEIGLLHNVADGFRSAKIYPKTSALAMECQRLLDVVQTQSRLEHRSQLLRIVAAVLSGEFKNAQAQRAGFDRAEDHMIQVFEKLSSKELLNLSIDELAAKFSCSRRHLSRLFHQHFGLSVAALRMEMRLLKAVSLLRDPEAKVINVAEQCGFNHLGLFNTCFKRRYGTSPGQWRKLSLNIKNPSPRKTTDKSTCPLQANGLCPWGDGQFGQATSAASGLAMSRRESQAGISPGVNVRSHTMASNQKGTSLTMRFPL